MKKKINKLTLAAMIAACYVALCYIFAFCSSGTIQVRVAEALCVLPYFTPAAIPGLTVGCLVSNLLTGCMPLDVVFGTLATLLGAIGSYVLRKQKWLVALPPMIANTLIVPQVLKHVYGAPEAVGFITVTVFIGEAISVGILGNVLLHVLDKKKFFNLL